MSSARDSLPFGIIHVRAISAGARSRDEYSTASARRSADEEEGGTEGKDALARGGSRL